jgi:hypothetical protein
MMSRYTDSVLSGLLKVSSAVFAAVLATSLSLSSIAMAGDTCGDCVNGQTGCSYSCGTIVNCGPPEYTECGCVKCNACCVGSEV